MALTQDTARDLARSIAEQVVSRFKQEFAGENEEQLDRNLRAFSNKVSRICWKTAQKWCKFDDEGPILMPDFTRIFYKKGNTEVVLQEFAPQVRRLKFHNALLVENDTTGTDVKSFTLGLPYVVFMFKFVGGIFQEVYCSFNNAPLKRLDETPKVPYLSNIGTDLRVCLGSFDRAENLEKGNIAQQCSSIISYFWQSLFVNELGDNYWQCKSHFLTNDARLGSLTAWQAATEENPLFVIDEPGWLPYGANTYGDMIVHLFALDNKDTEFQHAISDDLSKEVLSGIKTDISASINQVSEQSMSKLIDQIADQLLQATK